MNSIETPSATEEAAQGEASGIPITILPELENLLPSTSDEEKADLRRSIENEGIRDSLLVWRTVNEQGEEVRILIDGHNRYRITESLGRDVGGLPYKDIDFADMEEAKAWIIANQLMRRNMTDEQRRYFRAKMYEALKGERGGDRKSKCNDFTLIDAAQTVADQCGVTKRTVLNDAVFAKRVDAQPPEEKAAVLRGDKKLPKEAKEAKAAKTHPEKPETVEHDEPEKQSAEPEAVAPVMPAASTNIFTIDDIKTIEIPAPHQAVYLIFRSHDRVQNYFDLLESLTLSEQESILAGLRELQKNYGKLIRTVEEMTTRDADTQEDNQGTDPARTSADAGSADF